MTTRRTIICRAFTAMACAAIFGQAHAAYPDRPIKIVVGFPAGQASDTLARVLAKTMAETLNQPVIIDNKPGAAGIISHEAVKNAAPDGYTILMGSSGTLAINPSLYRKLPYDSIRDFAAVGLVAGSPMLLFTAAASPFDNLKELITYVKANPGKVTYGSPGSGTTAHISMEMVKKAAGIDMLHVPYKGSPAMITDVISGQVDVAFETAIAVVGFAKAGRIKLLGISSKNRAAIAPEVPTIAEQGVTGFDATPWSAIVAPKGTPPEILQKLNEAVNKALKDPVVIEEFGKTGGYPLGGSVTDVRKFMQEEIARWGTAVKTSGASVD